MAHLRPRRLAVAGLLAVAWLASTGAIGGCNLFQPATPEAPSGTTIVGNYTHWDSTLNALSEGMRSKGQSGGTDVYVAALADSGVNGQPDGALFRADFDPATVRRYIDGGGALVPVWVRPRELIFFSTVLGNITGAVDLVWSPDSLGTQGDDEIGAGSVFIHRRYRVYTRLGDGTTRIIVSGYADLRVIQPGTRWVVSGWVDREDPFPPEGAISYGLWRLQNQ